MQQQNENKFSFINEKIKEKPINKRKLVIQSAFTVGMAIVFGVIASLVFACLAPKFGQMFYPDDERLAITIPKDSIAETEATEQAGTEDEAEKAEPVVELPLEFELSLADYQKLQNKLYDVGRTANKFVVTVTGVKSDTDWFNNAYESKGRASGIIIGDNGQELLILTQRKVISDAQEVYVTFINNETVAASMKKYVAIRGCSAFCAAGAVWMRARCGRSLSQSSAIRWRRRRG